MLSAICIFLLMSPLRGKKKLVKVYIDPKKVDLKSPLFSVEQPVMRTEMAF